ncbi:MAG: hypothetical protein SFY32_13975 [Bacteroidota bacterium]|nr:hypothetical protein [Bacteroidota bacterium]
MDKKVKEELAKTLIDLGKYVFAGLVLGLVVQFDSFNKIYLLGFGLFLTLFLIVIGLYILKK